jgi:HEPN domain-containing protein
VDLEDLCYAAQQAAEKAVKAVFVRRGADPPRTHDLARLLSLLADAGEQVPAELYAAAELTPYAVGARYPGALRPLTEAEHLRALDLAQQVFERARSLVEGGEGGWSMTSVGEGRVHGQASFTGWAGTGCA